MVPAPPRTSEVTIGFLRNTGTGPKGPIASLGSLTYVDAYRFIVCLFDLFLYVPSTIFQLNRDGSSRVEPVLS